MRVWRHNNEDTVIEEERPPLWWEDIQEDVEMLSENEDEDARQPQQHQQDREEGRPHTLDGEQPLNYDDVNRPPNVQATPGHRRVGRRLLRRQARRRHRNGGRTPR